MRKVLCILIMVYSYIVANEIDYNKLLKPLDDNKSKDFLTQFMNKQNVNSLDGFYNQVVSNNSLLDKNNTLDFYLKEQKNYSETRMLAQKEFKSFTIFYFISEDTSIDLIRNFSYEIEKLKELDKGINGLLLTRGLIGGSFDSMANYVQNLQNEKIKKLEVTFHPWAFEYFNLEKVPAYAISYCKEDFRFKTCEHKYLVRGELSLTNFFEIVSDEDENYKKYYQKLIEAK